MAEPELVEYTPELFDLVRAFYEANRGPRDATLADWLFNQIPRNTMVLALADGRCVAWIAALHTD